LLITDLAPYASLVQRFGRCNRTGEFMEAHIFWVDLPLNGKDAKLAAQDTLDRKEQERIALPYAWHHLETARTLLADMQSASPADLPNHHDLGKAHRIFQSTLQWLPPGADPHMPWLAKSTRGGTHSRPHFRHELASALALLYMGASDLTVYLAACHHGKVRLSIRALPGETKPDAPDKKYARGIWDGDALPVTDLGDGGDDSGAAFGS